MIICEIALPEDKQYNIYLLIKIYTLRQIYN